MNRLERTRNQIVAQAFPELAGAPIDVRWKGMKNSLFTTTIQTENLFKQSFSIAVDNSLKEASHEVLEGGMANGLAHIALEFGMGTLLSMLDGALSEMSSRYKTWDERRADRKVIERGFGPQLREFVVYANQRYEDYDKHDGLTAEEIQTLIPRRRRPH